MGVSPPSSAAGAAMAVSARAPRQGVIPARAKRIEPPLTTTRLHSSETTGSSR